MIRIKGNNIILETIRSGMVLKTGDVAELLYYGEKLSGDFGYAQIGGDNSKNRNCRACVPLTARASVCN